MANAKKVRIEGELPFNILEGASESLVHMFAEFASPAWGLRITYGKARLVPSAWGGQTAYYPFKIAGTEALWAESLIKDLREMASVGTIFTVAQYHDEGDDFRAVYNILDQIIFKTWNR